MPTNLPEHARRKLQDELARMLPYLEDLRDREYTPEEREFLAATTRAMGRPLTPQEERIHIAQARMIGNL